MLGVVIKGFEKILKQKEGESMMQGTEGRWRQSRRRSKHEVPPHFFLQILKPNPTVDMIQNLILLGILIAFMDLCL